MQIGKELDALPDSTGRDRLADWSRYISGERIPTQPQLKRLSRALRIPFNVLRIATGYVDEPLQCCYRVAVDLCREDWPHEVKPRRAAFGLLFSLFPCKGMHIDNRLTVAGLMHGTTVRLNIVEEEGYLTGQHWNATWLYPERFQPHALIYDKFDANVQYITSAPESHELVELKVTEQTYVPNVAIRAEAQIDIASPIAETIVSGENIAIPVVHFGRSPTRSSRSGASVIHANQTRDRHYSSVGG